MQELANYSYSSSSEMDVGLIHDTDLQKHYDTSISRVIETYDDVYF